MTINSDISEALIRHDVDLMRLDAGTRRKVLGMLAQLQKHLGKTITRADPTGPKMVAAHEKRLNLLIAASDRDIKASYKQIAKLMDAELRDIAAHQSGVTAATINSAVTVELVSGRLNKNVLVSLAKDTLIEGAPSSEWWAEQSEQLQKSFKREMREGVVLNETISDLIRRVRGRREHGFKDGIMAASTRKAKALVRTSIMAVANEARLTTYKENSDVIKGVQVQAVLDHRTSTQCQALDGQAWTLDGKRLPGTQLPWRGPPPFHWGCRSSLVPVLKSWSTMAKNRKVKTRLMQVEDKAGIRASMDGKVADTLNYEAWLKSKPEEFQLEVLGPTKHRLWKKGQLPFQKLVDQSHNPLTVKELQMN